MIFFQISIYFTFIIVTSKNGLSNNCLLYWKSPDFWCTSPSSPGSSSCLLLSFGSFSPFILPRCLAVLGEVSFLVTIITAKISLRSSVITPLGLGLLWAVSLHVPGLISGVTVAQGLEFVFTIHNDQSCLCWGLACCCIDEGSTHDWSCDCVDLHPDRPVLPRQFSSPDQYRLSVQSCLGLGF